MASFKKTKKNNFPSELRFDLISKDWIVIASGRAKRPASFKRDSVGRKTISATSCPFCINFEKQANPSLVFADGKKVATGEKIPKNWTVIVMPNRYPAFLPSSKLDKRLEGGLYQRMNAVGFHEVVVFRNHNKQLAEFSLAEMKEVIDVYQQRYLDLRKKKFVNYIAIFHNQGAKAGASIIHPHSQIITTPLLDVDLRQALANSKDYFKSHKKCVYCQMANWERRTKKRVVFENRNFLALCPFASKSAFQTIISPKKHLSYFERITEEEKRDLAEMFRIVLRKLYKGLNNPDYNFYLHTAPCDTKDYSHYHWHWTILPKATMWAGFELGTRIEISTIAPEVATAYLRKIQT